MAQAARAVERVEKQFEAEREKKRKIEEVARAKLKAKEARKKEKARLVIEQKKATLKAAAEELKSEKAAQLAKERAKKRKAAERVRAKRAAARAQRSAQVEHARAEARSAREALRAERSAKNEERKHKLERAKQLALIASTIRQAEREANKAAAQRARLDAKEAREHEKERAKEASERARKARILAKELAKAAAKEQARELAHAQSQRREFSKSLQRSLADSQRQQVKRWGAPLSDLVEGAIAALSNRPDVQILNDDRGPAVPLEDIPLAAFELPAAVLAWHSTIGPRKFVWTIAQDSGEDLVGGCLDLPPLNELSSESDLPDFDSSLARAVSFAFINSEESYYSSQRSLRQIALPPFTSADTITRLLEGRGMQNASARALVRLMGPRATLLFHAEQVQEGRRRFALRNAAAVLPKGEIDLSLLSQMNSGCAVEKQEFFATVAVHQEFLAAGGGAGNFEQRTISGLPHFVYTKHPSPPGQAILCFENLSELSFSGVNLSFADLSAIRAEKTNLSKAKLSGSVCAYSILEGAKFQSANLTGTDFTRARLKGADFRGANLTDTNFENADLRGANFSGAITSRTMFRGANVHGIKY